MTTPAVPLDGSLSRLLLLPPWKLMSSRGCPTAPSLFWPPALHLSTLALTLVDSLRLNDSFKVTPLPLCSLSCLRFLRQCQWSEGIQASWRKPFPHLGPLSALTPQPAHTPRSSSCVSPSVLSTSHLPWLPGRPCVSVMSTEHT